MEEDDLEMLRQAALKSMVTNKQKPSRSSGAPTSSRVKTNGNLIEIQPSDDISAVESGELNPEDFVVEEFVIEGSDGSIHSSDCDEVIEEVIMSDVEDVEESAPETKEPERLTNTEENSGVKPSSPRSTSSNRQNTSDDDDESDAVSIKSSYSLIMDEDEEFQSVEAKFLSKKIQKDKVPASNSSISAGGGPSRRKRSRSPIELPSRARNPGRRSRSRERELNVRSTNRKSRSRSRSPPGRRRMHSPLQRGTRRPHPPHRTNSPDRGRRRRSRSRSLPRTSTPPRPKLSNRRPKSRSNTPPSDRPKPRPANPPNVVKAPSEEKQPEKIQKTVRNNNIPPEQLERLEKRRRKFEGESVVPGKNHVIKITSSAKDKEPGTSSQSSKPSPPSASGKSVVLKEKVPKASKRSVELVKESDLRPSSEKSSTSSSKEKSSGGDNQEDLRARLIKKKMEKQLQHGSSSSSSSTSSTNGVLSSVVVPVNNKGSHRIFSQALKNSQLLEAAANDGAMKSSSGKSERPQTSSPSSTSHKSTKSRTHTHTSESRSSGSKKPSSAGRGNSSSSSSASRSKSGPRGAKRVVSVTYS